MGFRAPLPPPSQSNVLPARCPTLIMTPMFFWFHQKAG